MQILINGNKISCKQTPRFIKNKQKIHLIDKAVNDDVLMMICRNC